MSNNWKWDTRGVFPRNISISSFVAVTCHIFRRFSQVPSYRDIIAKTFRSEYFGKKMSREKRRISDGAGGGYEKHLNEIPLALGCMAWQSDTPPTCNRVIRRLTEPSSRPATSYDRLPAPLADFADYSTSWKRIRQGREDERTRGTKLEQAILSIICPVSLLLPSLLDCLFIIYYL